ncbi:MAG: FecR domain-containing protein, partial [Anaerolineales bacterium]|nr:FecR domain-containing protein [Anaerolineales bacterium]
LALLVCGLATTLGIGSYFLVNRQANIPIAPVSDELEGEDIEQVDKIMSRLSPSEALLVEPRGLVEIQEHDEWSVAGTADIITVNARVRTGSLSSASLIFNDGSRLQLGPNSEISIDKLDANPDKGVREVVLTQWSGESDHIVTPVETEDARYEVQTASATGLAQGTEFSIRVMPEVSSWYVSDGAVEVSGVDASVLVGAGKMTTVNLDEEPDEPSYFITGQGEVSYIGENWVIGGQTYLTHAHTVIIGNPQVGDVVFFEGHLLEDERRVADVIVLIQRNPANTFTLIGEVEAIGDVLWTVNGQTIAVTDITEVDEDIAENDLVRVEGIILQDGSLQAERIMLIEDQPGAPFDFTGVVQQVGDDSWLVSDVKVSIDDNTLIDEGLVPGDLVRVRGWILEDGTWLAGSIRRVLDAPGTFEFSGTIDSIDPWVVAKIPFETRAWTVIDEGLSVGDLVRVKGQIQTGGIWVAYEIKSYDQALVTILIGRVFSMDPWIVSGIELNVDEQTVIVGDITVGMLVRVEMHLLPDGTHKVIRIEPVEGFEWELGCHYLIVTVVSVDGDHIRLEGWPDLPLDENVEIVGDLKPGSIVQIMICFDEDMNVKVVYILIIFTPELPPPDIDDDPDEKGKKVAICHKPNGKNPHTIVVSSSAVPAHLGHGDILGHCP